MEAVATFFILLIIYFLGSLAVVQYVIRPMRKPVFDAIETKKRFQTNHTQILMISFLLSLATTILAYWAFS
jgi:hypothetical protein